MTNYFRAKKRLVSLVVLLVSFFLVFAPSAKAIEVVISGNGAESTNEVAVEQTSEIVIEQTNEANIENEVEVEANTGDNTVSENTGGDVTIDTGDVVAQVVVENAVNDSSVEIECCLSGVDVIVADNGADSQNTVELEMDGETSVVVQQTANIVNKVSGSANTGDNVASNNNGNVTIDTGDIYVSGGVNNGPVNVTHVGGSSGSGDVSVNISENGADSINSIFLALNNSSDIQISSFFDINNNVAWNLNTGGNEASGNSGDVEIITGDIFFDFFIKNGPINIGGIDWGCCNLSDPADPEGSNDPNDPSDPSDPDSGDPEIGGSNSSSGSSGGGGDGGGNSSSSSDVGGLSILGLSDTSSAQAKSVIFFAGLIMMIAGFRLIGKETLQKNPQ